MAVRFDRIERAQVLMREQGMAGLMIMNHDDYRYFFGRDWTQPRAIIPFQGPPLLIVFRGEEPEIRRYVGEAQVKVFTHVGEQMAAVSDAFREMLGPAQAAGLGDKPKIGMQMWFGTPAFLVDMFRKVNPRFELVASDPVMDALRMVKAAEEVEFLTEAQRIAALGMDRAREMLTPGITGHEIATEALYTMMKAGAEGTSTPLHVNAGPDSCMIHGHVSPRPLEGGDLVVIDLTPQVEGYGANLARTFVVGEADDTQRKLIEIYGQMVEATRRLMKPGVKVRDLDARGREICAASGLGDYHLEGIAHGIGLRFEETPASTIIKPHRNIELRQGMTMTIGHTILAIPGVGGVRNEDVYLVTPDGGHILNPYPASIEFLGNAAAVARPPVVRRRE
jgi:Xaa-Pro dipeptidase